MKNHTPFLATTVLTVTLLLLLTLTACSAAPTAEEITPRLRELVEASYSINDIFFGEGLPTYPRVEKLTDQPLSYDAEHDAYYLFFTDKTYGEMCMYYNKTNSEYIFMTVSPSGSEANGDSYVAPDGRVFTPVDYTEPEVEYVYTDDDAPNYDVVRLDCGYTTIESLKEAAGKVYSADFLEEIYQGAFDGVAYAESGYSGVRSARFIEQNLLLRQNNDIESRSVVRRSYDFDTVKIIRPSNANRINLTVDTREEGSDEILNIHLTMVRGEDGKWYLDSPTY